MGCPLDTIATWNANLRDAGVVGSDDIIVLAAIPRLARMSLLVAAAKGMLRIPAEPSPTGSWLLPYPDDDPG